jgi:hypothetical protein
LNLVHDAPRCASDRSSPGTHYGSDWPTNHRAGCGANRCAGTLLPGGASSSQETQGCNKHELLHERPPHNLNYEHKVNFVKAEQFASQIGEDATEPVLLEVWRSLPLQFRHQTCFVERNVWNIRLCRRLTWINKNQERVALRGRTLGLSALEHQ